MPTRLLLALLCTVGSLTLAIPPGKAFRPDRSPSAALPPTGETTPFPRLLEPDGSPLVGATVYPLHFTSEQTWVFAPVVSDAAGRFRLPDTESNLVIVLPPVSAIHPNPMPFFLPLGKSGKPAPRVIPARGFLSVRFLDGDGKPFVDREVLALPEAPPSER